MRNTRGIVPKVGVLWGLWSEAEGGPTGDGLVQLQVNVVRDGPWGWVMANGVGSVGLEDVKWPGVPGVEDVFRVEDNA